MENQLPSVNRFGMEMSVNWGEGLRGGWAYNNLGAAVIRRMKLPSENTLQEITPPSLRARHFAMLSMYETASR